MATAGDIASAMRWWRDAGVDVLIDEAPRDWLTRRPPKVEVAAPQRPASLVALVEWLMTSPDAPEAGPPSRRVPPSGDPASGLMILSDVPDAADGDAGTLMSGELSPMFVKMLAALGRDRGSVYLASLSAGRPPSGRLNAATLDTLAETARAHIGFVAPKRLWLLGAAPSRAILGMTDVEAHGKLHAINLNGCMIDVVVTAHPRFLDTREKKARAWTEMQRLLEKDAL